MKFILNKKNIIYILEYIISFNMILEANSIWLHNHNTKSNLNLLAMIGCIIISILIEHKDLKYKKNFIQTCILIMSLCIMNLIFMLVNNDNIVSYILKFIFIMPLFIFYIMSRIKDSNDRTLLKKISKIMITLSIISLIFFVFGTCLNIIKPSSDFLLDWGGERYISSYFGIHYNAQSTMLNGMYIHRNTGIFTEAPAYSYLLCIALTVELFLKSRVTKINVLILTITIFTTTSLTGILISLALLSTSIILQKYKLNIINIVRICTIPIIIVVAVSIGLFFITDKVNGSRNNNNGSFSIRSEDYKVAIEAWSDNILFGHGYGRHDLTQKYMRYSRGEDTGGSNGLIILLPQGGIFLLSSYLVPFLLSLNYLAKKRKLNDIMLIITIFILFLLSNMVYTFIMLYFLASGWTTKLRNKKYENKAHIF